jgi:hypothetical protein
MNIKKDIIEIINYDKLNQLINKIIDNYSIDNIRLVNIILLLLTIIFIIHLLSYYNKLNNNILKKIKFL